MVINEFGALVHDDDDDDDDGDSHCEQGHARINVYGPHGITVSILS